VTTDQANYYGSYPYGNNPKGKCREGTIEVGSFPANTFGLHDMHGNVWDWCNDWFSGYGTGTQINPTGDSSGSRGVLRGGSWCSDAQDLHFANRDYYSPGDRVTDVGFRLLWRTP